MWIINFWLPLPHWNEGNLELAARNYIVDAAERIRSDYGLTFKTSAEIEFYALDSEGTPSSHILDLEKINALYKDSPFVDLIEHENPNDMKGQYELKLHISDDNPLKTGIVINNVRAYIKNEAHKYGLGSVDFSPVISEELEPSGMHINWSLWNGDTPIFADEYGEITSFMRFIAKGMSSSQRWTTALSAQTEISYARLNMGDWAPSIIGVSERGNSTATLREANSSNMARKASISFPDVARIEDRLSDANANGVVAVAAGMMGIEYALKKNFSTSELKNTRLEKLAETRPLAHVNTSKTTISYLKKPPVYDVNPLPKTFEKAKNALKQGVKQDWRFRSIIPSEIATEVLGKIGEPIGDSKEPEYELAF